MKILTKDQLPETQEEYFEFFHHRSRTSPNATKDDLLEVIGELRLAFKKYPNKGRIQSMANVLKIATKSKNPVKDIKQEIEDILF